MASHGNLPEKTKFFEQVSPSHLNTSIRRNSLKIFFRQKTNILVFFVSTVISVGIFTYLSAEVYRSDSQVFLKLGRESLAVDPSVVGPTARVYSNRESELNSEVATLKSQILAENVVKKVGPNVILNRTENDSSHNRIPGFLGSFKFFLTDSRQESQEPLLEIATSKILNNLIVETEKDSHIINISYQAETPKMANKILTVLLDQYLDRHIEMHQAQAPPEFFMKKSESLRATLFEKEELLKKFQEQNLISSMDSQKKELLEQISVLQAETDEVVSLIGASRAKIASINNSLLGQSPNREITRVVGRPNRAVETIKTQLLELRSQEVDLAAHYPDTDRGLIDLREKIKLTEDQLSKESETLTEITQGIDTNYQALKLGLANEKAQLQSLIARHKVLEDLLESRNKSLLKLSSHETKLNSLQRETDIAQKEYHQYRESLQRAQISAELDSGRISNISIVQPPTMSVVPIKPNKKLNILLGILFGLIGGLVFAFLRDHLDDNIKDREDVEEKLGLPVLASISKKDFEACI